MERWAAIAGFDDMYEVSDEGRMRSWRGRNGKRTEVPRIMRTGCDANGYARVNLYANRESTVVRIHRLVLLAFVGQPADGMAGAHLNGNSRDNRLVNLAWVTPAVNNEHKVWHGTLPSGTKHWRSVLNDDQVREIRALVGQGHTRAALGRRFHVSASSIADVVNGRSWRHVA